MSMPTDVTEMDRALTRMEPTTPLVGKVVMDRPCDVRVQFGKAYGGGLVDWRAGPLPAGTVKRIEIYDSSIPPVQLFFQGVGQKVREGAEIGGHMGYEQTDLLLRMFPARKMRALLESHPHREGLRAYLGI